MPALVGLIVYLFMLEVRFIAWIIKMIFGNIIRGDAIIIGVLTGALYFYNTLHWELPYVILAALAVGVSVYALTLVPGMFWILAIPASGIYAAYGYHYTSMNTTGIVWAILVGIGVFALSMILHLDARHRRDNALGITRTENAPAMTQEHSPAPTSPDEPPADSLGGLSTGLNAGTTTPHDSQLSTTQRKELIRENTSEGGISNVE